MIEASRNIDFPRSRIAIHRAYVDVTRMIFSDHITWKARLYDRNCELKPDD